MLRGLRRSYRQTGGGCDSAAQFELEVFCLSGEFEVVIFLTGAGTRVLVNVIEPAYSRDAIATALARTRIVARGPKPLAVLREMKVPVWIAVPEPNTWQ